MTFAQADFTPAASKEDDPFLVTFLRYGAKK
jgi:hypothetical protein